MVDSSGNQELSASTPCHREAVFFRLVDWFIDCDPCQTERYVRDLRQRYPLLSDDELAGRVVSLKSLKNGLVGAAAGVPGFLALPLTIPADLLASWKIQINMAMAVAAIYGHSLDRPDGTRDLKTDIFVILAGNAAKDCFQVLGVEVDAVTHRTVRRYLAREVTIELWKRLTRRIVAAAGARSASRISRAVPLVGAPIGFAFDYAAARNVGDFARDYYRPLDAAAEPSTN